VAIKTRAMVEISPPKLATPESRNGPSFFQGDSAEGADPLKTSEGWSQFTGGFFIGAMGGAVVAFFLLENFELVDSIFRGLFNS
jgi:photosystem I subunit 11